MTQNEKELFYVDAGGSCVRFIVERAERLIEERKNARDPRLTTESDAGATSRRHVRILLDS